jgi:hypothetical protein
MESSSGESVSKARMRQGVYELIAAAGSMPAKRGASRDEDAAVKVSLGG